MAPQKAGMPHWHPNQLRHTFATEVRRTHGLEVALAALGHSKADMTQIYAERDAALAAKVAAEIGLSRGRHGEPCSSPCRPRVRAEPERTRTGSRDTMRATLQLWTSSHPSP